MNTRSSSRQKVSTKKSTGKQTKLNFDKNIYILEPRVTQADKDICGMTNRDSSSNDPSGASISTRMEEKLDKLFNRLDQVESTLKNEIREIVGRVEAVEKKILNMADTTARTENHAQKNSIEIQQLQTRISLQDKLIKALQQNVDDIQGRIRRKTLIFRGVPEGREGSDSWQNCKLFISNFISNHLGLRQRMEIERAHRSPSVRDHNRAVRRLIIVQFLRWEDANIVLTYASKALKKNPFKDEKGGTIPIFIEQMYSPEISRQRKQALLVRKHLKNVFPEAVVFLKYHARLYIRYAEDKDLVQYDWKSYKLN